MSDDEIIAALMRMRRQPAAPEMKMLNRPTPGHQPSVITMPHRPMPGYEGSMQTMPYQHGSTPPFGGFEERMPYRGDGALGQAEVAQPNQMGIDNSDRIRKLMEAMRAPSAPFRQGK